ncbi:MAG: restriction endonuclease, partial [Bacteroidales bacterium]|nr:restriction endonuclease [Bacteroidales bacterium]
TYALERTKLNHAIGLDDSEAELDPQNPNPRGAHGGDEEKDPLDEIIRIFNERWFQGWSATPEEQRVKFISTVKEVKKHIDFQSKFADNKDAQNRKIAIVRIINDVMMQLRKKDLGFYKLYAQDDAFNQSFIDSIIRVLDNPRIEL